jgi:hypothetical protein
MLLIPTDRVGTVQKIARTKHMLSTYNNCLNFLIKQALKVQILLYPYVYYYRITSRTD